jgi:hypothetical protein
MSSTSIALIAAMFCVAVICSSYSSIQLGLGAYVWYVRKNGHIFTEDDEDEEDDEDDEKDKDDD